MQELLAHGARPYTYHDLLPFPLSPPFNTITSQAHKHEAECISYCIFCVGFDQIKYFTLLREASYTELKNLDDLLTFLLTLSLFQVFGSFLKRFNLIGTQRRNKIIQ